jgi:hypothetical protein
MVVFFRAKVILASKKEVLDLALSFAGIKICKPCSVKVSHLLLLPAMWSASFIGWPTKKTGMEPSSTDMTVT